jgi:hypothetical protein
MLHLAIMIALTAAVVTAPIASPSPSPAADIAAATRSTSEARTAEPAHAPKRPVVEFPWTRYATIERKNAEMQAELDRFFGVDRLP